jgi:hypothetical protein
MVKEYCKMHIQGIIKLIEILEINAKAALDNLVNRIKGHNLDIK